MSAGSLADGFVELQLKTDQMQAEMRQVIADTSKTAKAAEEAFNKVANKGVKRATDAIVIQRMEAMRLGVEYKKIRLAESISSGRGATIAGFAAQGMRAAATIAASATALTFAGAAAAGSTTLDTLTGSLKKLSLAAGKQTQGPVLQISRLIQSLAESAKSAPAGSITMGAMGITGAIVGGKLAGPIGAMAGGAAGIMGGGFLEMMTQNQAFTNKLTEKIAKDPKGIEKAKAGMAALEKQRDELTDTVGDWMKSPILFTGLVETNAQKRGKINDAIAMIKDSIGKREEAFLTAGLPGGGGSVGLMEYRQEPTTAGEGALGIANKIEELKLNLNAVNFTQGWRATVNPLFVGPPAP